MMRRAWLAAVQMAVFVGGGLLAPVLHVAWHRPDHTHGPSGRKAALEFEARGPVDDPHPHPHHHAARPQDGHTHDGGERAEPLDLPHGHFTLAHFGLALLSAAPPLALPAPAPAGRLTPSAHPRVTALFEPSFPLPRPPPNPSLT